MADDSSLMPIMISSPRQDWTRAYTEELVNSFVKVIDVYAHFIYLFHDHFTCLFFYNFRLCFSGMWDGEWYIGYGFGLMSLSSPIHYSLSHIILYIIHEWTYLTPFNQPHSLSIYSPKLDFGISYPISFLKWFSEWSDVFIYDLCKTVLNVP